jgi:glycosyltransferase involved in cell wall biosynthesis
VIVGVEGSPTKLKSMKVLHVIPAVSPKYGGPSEALVPMCKALLKRGIDVQIASTDAEPGGRISVELGTPTSYKGVPGIFFKKQGRGSFTYSLPLARWLSKNVSRFHVVHIHGVFSHVCLAAARGCQRQGVPYLLRPLGHIESWSLAQKPLRKRVFLRTGGTSMLRKAAALHYVSLKEQELSESALKLNHGVVIPLGIDLQTPNFIPRGNGHAADDRRPYVLVLSRLRPAKGIDVLLEAFLAVREDKRFADWQLMIAGDGSPQYEDSLKKIIKQKNAGDAVRLTGWLEGDAKSRALAGASLMALPSHHDAFGLCVIEAMAHGIPVLVGTEVGLAEEIIVGGAGWASEVKLSALSETLASILGDDDERRGRGMAGRGLARKFDWQHVAEMLVRLYESMQTHDQRNA